MNLKKLAFEALKEAGMVLQEDELVDTMDYGTTKGAKLGWLHRVRRLPKEVLKNLKFVVVPVCRAPFNQHSKALEWAKNNLVGIMTPEETGGKGVITISTSSVREMINQRQREKSESNDVHFAALTGLKDIIKMGIIIESHPDYKKNESGVRSIKAGVNDDIKINVAYTAMSFDGKFYRVKTTLKSYPLHQHSKAYAYEVSKIEVLPGTLGGKNDLTTNPSGKTSIIGGIILKNAKGVNGTPFL